MTNDFIEAGKAVRLAAEKLKSTDLEIERLETLKAERATQEAELEAAQARLLDAAEVFEDAKVAQISEVPSVHPGELAEEAIPGYTELLDEVVDGLNNFTRTITSGGQVDPGLETETTAPDWESPEADVPGEAVAVTVTDVVTGETETLQVDAEPQVVSELEARKADLDERNAEIQRLREEREKRDAANVPANAPSPEAEMAGVMMQEASERLAETAEQVGEVKTIIDATDDVLPEPTQEEIDAVLNDDTPFPGMGGGLASSQPD